MNDHAIVDGRVGRDDDRITTNLMAISCSNVGLVAALDLVSVRSRKNLSTVSFNRMSEASQIFQRMKLRLARKVQTWSGVEALQRGPIKPLHPSQASPMRRR